MNELKESISVFFLKFKLYIYCLIILLFFVYLHIEKNKSYDAGYEKRNTELNEEYSKILKERDEREAKKVNDLNSIIQKYKVNMEQDDNNITLFNQKEAKKITEKSSKFNTELSQEEIKKLNDLTRINKGDK